MPYNVLYRREFKRQKDECCRTYNTEDEINAWLRSIIKSAENRESSDSLDIIAILEQQLEGDQPEEEESFRTLPSKWLHSWQKFKAAPFVQKAKLVLAAIRTATAPCELRAACEEFGFLDNLFTERVFVYYEIDHANRRVVFREWDGLPGQ